MIEESWKLCPFTYRRQKIEVSTFGNVRVKGKILEKRVSNGRNVVTIGKTKVFAVEHLVAYGFKITNHLIASVDHLDGRPLNDCPYNLIPFLDSFEWATKSKILDYRKWIKVKEARKRREIFYQEQLAKTSGIRLLASGESECCKCQSHNIVVDGHHCECNRCENWSGCGTPYIFDYYQCRNCGEREKYIDPVFE